MERAKKLLKGDKSYQAEIDLLEKVKETLEQGRPARILELSDEEKESFAYEFALRYRDNISEFRNFISTSEFSVMLPYQESWNFIKSDCESLKRHTNLGLCLPE